MLDFERRYIPLLLLTAQADSVAVAASEKLVTQWNEFKQKQAYQYSDDSLWGFDLVKIERAILNSQRLIQAGNYTQAYQQLDSVRLRFSSMRERHKISFYIDGLIRFDVAMMALRDKAESEKTDDLYVEISAAKKAWANIQNAEFNYYDYKLSVQEMEYLQQCIVKGEELLMIMQEQFRSAQYDRLGKTVLQMQEVYNTTYAIFARN